MTTHTLQSKKELIDRLEYIAKSMNGDPEVAHNRADEALLGFINDAEVKTAYDEINKWYA